MAKKTNPEKKVHILLVEDEESFIDALNIGLDREGFKVSVARDGQQAMALFARDAFDVILLDLMLPKMSGLDVCRSIRATSDVPIIIVSADVYKRQAPRQFSIAGTTSEDVLPDCVGPTMSSELRFSRCTVGPRATVFQTRLPRSGR